MVRSESEGSCSRYGFASAADLIENNMQGKRMDNIVEDIAGIVEAYQNTKGRYEVGEGG